MSVGLKYLVYSIFSIDTHAVVLLDSMGFFACREFWGGQFGEQCSCFEEIESCLRLIS